VKIPRKEELRMDGEKMRMTRKGKNKRKDKDKKKKKKERKAKEMGEERTNNGKE
jgi:hypothetical protein